MRRDCRAVRQVRRHPVRGRLAHRLASFRRPTMWRISAERPPVREATVWLLSTYHRQYLSQPSSLMLQSLSGQHLQPLTFGRW